MRIKTKGYFYLITSLLTGALLPIVLAVATNVNIFEFFLLVYLIALPVSLLFLFYKKKTSRLTLILHEPKQLLLILFVGFLTYMSTEILLSYSEHFVSASLATVIFRMTPLLMLLFAPLILREKPTKRQVVALVLAFGGLYLAINNGNIFGAFNGNLNLPIIAILFLTAVGYALANTLTKRFVFDMSSAIVIFNVMFLVIFSVLFVATGMQSSLFTPIDIIALLYIAVINNLIGPYLYFSGLRIVKTTLYTNIFFISPFITILFAHFVLGEVIKPYYILIALLVAAGVALQKYDAFGGTYLQKRKETGYVIFDVTGAFGASRDDRIIRQITNGGRVLAVKLHERNYKTMVNIAKQNDGTHIFTDNSNYTDEETKYFVRDIVGRTEDEIVVMSAGNIEKSEEFFSELQKKAS